MAFADLNPVGVLWQEQGLRALLQAAAVPAAQAFSAALLRGASAPAGQQGAVAAGQPQPARPWGPAQGASKGPREAQPQRQGSGPSFSQAAKATFPQEQSRGQNRHSPHPAPEAVRTETARARSEAARTEALGQTRPDSHSEARGDSWHPLPTHVWPHVWREQLQRTRAGQVVWTYHSLGRDLRGIEHALREQRRAFLQRVLKDLAHPAGSHTFWPATLPTDDPDAPDLEPVDGADCGAGFAPNAAVFWSGVQQLGARGVVVMGSAAAKAIGLPRGLHPLEQIRYHGFFVWVLRDVEFLLHGEQGYKPMLTFLRSSLRFLIR